MSELISNGERLLSVRQKLNATLRPYASRAEFELATVPEGVTLVNVIDGSVIYQLTLDTGGDWTSGDGATWQGRILDGVAQSVLEGLLADAQAAADETGADVIAAEAAQAGAQTARTGAETARDAAFVNADVYDDIAAGLAAVADGEQFQVVSGDDLIRYRRDSATTQTEVARYPSAAGVSGDLVAINAGARASTDLIPLITWSANTLLFNNGTATTFSGYSTTQFIEVTPGATLALNCGVNHSSQTITVASYDGSQSFVSALYTGAVPVSPETGNRVENTQQITIPAGVRFIRVGQQVTANLTVLTVLSVSDEFWQEDLEPLLKPSESSNLIIGGNRFIPSTGGAVTTNAIYWGSGYVPVQIGDTITWNLATQSAVYGIALYDASKTFIRFIEGNTSVFGIEKRHTLNPTDDAGAAYIVCGNFSNTIAVREAGYVYVTSQNSLDRKIYEAVSGPVLGRGVHKTVPVLFSLTAGGLGIEDRGETLRVTVNAVPSYLTVDTKFSTREQGEEKGIRAYRIKLVSLPDGVTDAAFYWHSAAQSEKATSGTTIIDTIGGEAFVWADSYSIAHLRCDTVGVVYDVLSRIEWLMSQSTFDALEAFDVAAIGGADQSSERRFGVSNLALRSVRAQHLETYFKGGKLAFFGNSLQYMMWPEIQQYVGMELTDLTIGGSSAQENLTDAKLAEIPTDVDVVTISSGSGGAPGSLSPASAEFPWAGYHGYLTGFGTDITSRDRTMSEGAINFAIDWISTNRPNARIMLISPAFIEYSNRDNSKWNEVFRALAEYRQLPLADVWNDADVSERNWSLLSYDGIHLGPEGRKRQGGVIVGKLRSLSW